MPTNWLTSIWIVHLRLQFWDVVRACLICALTAGCTAPTTGGAAGSALGAPGATAGAPPATLWSFLGLSKAQKAACLAQLCANPVLGPASNAMLAPLGVLTGGLFGGLCPPSSMFGAGGSPAQDVAGAIAADEASAKQRVAAVEYLATVDCHYWPDVEEAIIASLRTDRNECVRYAAAKSLITGCCCGKKTIEALTIVVNRSEKDGHPSENSDRVIAAACLALQRCLAVFCDDKAPVQPELPEALTPENGREPATAGFEAPATGASGLPNIPGILPSQVRQNSKPQSAMVIPPEIRAYYRVKLASKPRETMINEGFQTLRMATTQKFWLGTSTIPPGSQSLSGILEKAGSIMPSGSKPLSRDQILKMEFPQYQGADPGTAPLPSFEPAAAAQPDIDMPGTLPASPQPVTIPAPASKPIFLSNPIP